MGIAKDVVEHLLSSATVYRDLATVTWPPWLGHHGLATVAWPISLGLSILLSAVKAVGKFASQRNAAETA